MFQKMFSIFFLINPLSRFGKKSFHLQEGGERNSLVCSTFYLSIFGRDSLDLRVASLHTQEERMRVESKIHRERGTERMGK